MPSTSRNTAETPRKHSVPVCAFWIACPRIWALRGKVKSRRHRAGVQRCSTRAQPSFGLQAEASSPLDPSATTATFLGWPLALPVLIYTATSASLMGYTHLHLRHPAQGTRTGNSLPVLHSARGTQVKWPDFWSCHYAPDH